MKRFEIRWAWCILIGLVLLTVVGCQSKAIQENIEPTGESTPMVAEPVGYRAIAASPGSKAEKAQRAVNTMSTSDKIGQLLMIELEGKGVTEKQRDLLRTYRVGGVVLGNDNMETKQQVRAFTKDLQETANVSSLAPLLLGTDRDRVRRASDVGRTNDLMITLPPSNRWGAISDDSLKNYMTRAAIEMRDLGFNLNMGPLVNTEATNSYTADPERAITIGHMLVQTYCVNNLFSTMKYFPGGGDYSVPGSEFPVTKDELMNGDGAVFQALIESTVEHTPMIMVNATRLPAIDSKSVSLSESILKSWLRNELGFTGVILTDDVSVGAAVTNQSIGDYAVRTILAGSDMVLVPKEEKQIKAVHTALTNAVESGRIPHQRLDDAVYHIMLMKFEKL